MDNRSKKFLANATKDSRILEIGPSCNPIAPKKDGWNVLTYDHGTKAELVDKYSKAGKDQASIDRIEEVDFVWRSGSMTQAIGEDYLGYFDFCFASHVIEHIPNQIGFYRDIARFLKPGGKLIMAVPDKRYCFDFFRPPSTAGEMIDVYRNNASRHSPKSAYDHFSRNSTNRGRAAWGQGEDDAFRLLDRPEVGLRKLDLLAREQDGAYVDLHGWVFTPSSYKLNILELNKLDLIDFYPERIFPSAGCEFIVHLALSPVEASDEDFNAERLALMKQTLIEQADPLMASPYNE